jgi:hypothetical protein
MQPLILMPRFRIEEPSSTVLAERNPCPTHFPLSTSSVEAGSDYDHDHDHA